MDTIRDFEDLLMLLEKHKARYLIVGGLAFIYHGGPRYTKDIDVWVGLSAENRARVNRALAEFGSPFLLESGDVDHILQIGMAPSRIDIMMRIEGVRFETAWRKKIRDRYGRAMANWMDLDDLIRAKRGLKAFRHQEDVRILRNVKRMRRRKSSQGGPPAGI